MKKNDDKEIINTSLNSLKNLKYTSGTLTLGNVEIFKLLISKLDIPTRWKLRLSRHFWREDYFNDLLKRLETNSDVDPTIVEIDKKRYLKMLKGDKNSIVAERSIEEILKRFDKKIKDPRRPSKGRNVSKIIKEFLKIKCPMSKAADVLNKFFKKYQINLVVDQRYFPTSINKTSKLNIVFSTSFGRQLEYYTGMVFKIDIKLNNKVKIMFPMVSILDDFIKAKNIVIEESEKLNIKTPPLGIMVETPSAALNAELYVGHVNFFSIGTNDLIQYTYAADRGLASLNKYQDPLDTGVLKLINNVIQVGVENNIEVSVCGDMASDKEAAIILYLLGLRVFSIAPSQGPNIINSLVYAKNNLTHVTKEEILSSLDSHNLRKLIS